MLLLVGQGDAIQGAAVLLEDTLQNSAITRCSFIENRVDTQGPGALEIVTNDYFVVKNSIFVNNSAGFDGMSFLFLIL